MPTIVDIANHLGVSKSTVAGVLNDAPGFRTTTRRRVLTAAKRLGYRPNYLSKALVGAKSMSIGVVIGSYDPLIIGCVQAIENASRAAGYRSYLVFAPQDSGPQVPMAVQDLIERRVDGFIVYSYEPLAPLRPVLAATEVPIVYLRAGPPDAAHLIALNRDEAVRDLAAHHRALGHRSVVELRWPPTPGYPPPSAHLTYDRGFAAEGVELVTGGRWMISLAPGHKETPAAAVYRMISQALADGERPTAITVGDDELAAAVMAAIADAGLRVPGDISVSGKDGHPIGEFCRPALTTIIEPQAEAGVAAFDWLLKLMRDPAAEVAPPAFEARLIVRGSTGPVQDHFVEQRVSEAY